MGTTIVSAPNAGVDIMTYTPFLLLALTGCTEDGNLNLFSIQEDIELGQQVHDEILADPETYPLLDVAAYPEAYDHLYRIRDNILASGEVQYADEFPWQTYIIHDDDTLNAFCAPGGYMYVYTGLIHYLDEEDQFAGVMGHEIAHADRRHSTQQLTKSYGISLLLEVLWGEDPELLAEVAAALVELSFSREDEAEADEYSVRYLCGTDYASNGAAGFFELLLEDASWQVPEFLSTHPSSDTRVSDINGWAETLECSIESSSDGQYEAFANSLP